MSQIINLTSGSGGVTSIAGLTGAVTFTNGSNITITEALQAITVGVSGTINHALQIGNVGGSLSSLAVGANGQTLMGNTGANCGWTSSPQFGGSVTALNDISSTAGNLVSLAGDLIARNTALSTAASNIQFQKARGANALTSGDALGQLRYTGYDGTGFITGAKITSTNSGTVGTNRVAGSLEFYTHPDSVIALPSEPLLRMTIDSTGAITAPIVYSTSVGATSKVALVDSTGLLGGLAGTAGQVLQGGASPAFSTATYPSTVALGDVLVASATNVVGVVNDVANAGYVLTVNVGAAPSFQAPGSSGITWARSTTTPIALVANHGYVQANAGAGLTVFTLPATAALGTTISIVGESAGGWMITQAAGQSIQYGNLSTTVGVTGHLDSTNRYDTVTLVCRVADTTWSILHAPVGILNVI